jgi:CheY-specific phosphatase CheX
MTAMKNSISNVLEKMFYLPLELHEHQGADSQAEMYDMLCSRLEFTGHLSGYFLFYVPESFAGTITADFLGKDKKDISTDDVRETLREVINMMAGNTFALYDDKAVFNLGIPRLILKDTLRTGNSGNEITIDVNTPEDHMVLKLVVNS